jgi:homocysteine S-methyltransferase
MRGPEFLARLHEEVLVGDGALGTMISERGISRTTNFERLNLAQPELIQSIHAAYSTAGAQVIETNTFGANRARLGRLNFPEEVASLNRAGVALARAAAGQHAYVAGALGPIQRLPDDETRDVFAEQIIALADAGADLLVLETFPDLQQLLLALAVAKQHTDLPVVCQLAFHERGYTQTGVDVPTALAALQKAGADVIGANCGRGVRTVVAAVEAFTQTSACLVSAFPNAGLPEFSDGRYLFGAPLPYLTEQAVRLADVGVNLIGGCCGTTPAYIQRVAELLRQRKPAARIRLAVEPPATVPATPTPTTTPPAQSLLHRLNEPGKKPLVVVEIDPPRGLNYQPMLKRCQQLRDMGVDAITVADNPVATLHMGNLAFAQFVQQEADLPVILHLTGRDHNLLGLQSRLLEAHVMGIRHILALTGDPARVGDQPGATSVFDLNSFGLVELLAKFNAGVNNAGLPLGACTQFSIGVAYNPNGTVRHLTHNTERLRKKVLAGAHFALTQPIYDPARFELMMDTVQPLHTPIFAGIMPLLSERNAEFVHNEVPGIVLTDDVRKRMRGLSGKEGRRVGTQICLELIDALVPRADAFYLIPPQRFTDMAVDLVTHITRCCQERRKTG